MSSRGTTITKYHPIAIHICTVEQLGVTINMLSHPNDGIELTGSDLFGSLYSSCYLLLMLGAGKRTRLSNEEKFNEYKRGRGKRESWEEGGIEWNLR